MLATLLKHWSDTKSTYVENARDQANDGVGLAGTRRTLDKTHPGEGVRLMDRFSRSAYNTLLG